MKAAPKQTSLYTKRLREEKKIRVLASRCKFEHFGTLTFIEPEYSIITVNKMISRLVKNLESEIPGLLLMYIVALGQNHGLHVHYMSNMPIKKTLKKLNHLFNNFGSISERPVVDQRGVAVRYMEQNIAFKGTSIFRNRPIKASSLELWEKFPESKFNRVVGFHGLDKSAVNRWMAESEYDKDFSNYVLQRIEAVAEGSDPYISCTIENFNYVSLINTTYIPHMVINNKSILYKFRSGLCDQRTKRILTKHTKFELAFYELLDSFLEQDGTLYET